MGKSDLPKRSLYRVAAPGELAGGAAAVAPLLRDKRGGAPAAAKPKTGKAGDRHSPGYMAEYMRKRRADGAKGKK